MTKKSKPSKTLTWIKNQNRTGAKLRDLLPTVKQYKKMSPSMKRSYTRIMMDYKSNSPSRQAAAFARITRNFHRLRGRTRVQQVYGEQMLSNLESYYFQRQEEYVYEIEEAPGDIYRQGKPGSGYGFMRLEHLAKDKHGKVKGVKTAREVGKWIMFKELKREQLTADPHEVKDYLDAVEFYDNGSTLVAVACYHQGGRRFIDVYNKATESTETIEQDLSSKGYPVNKLDKEALEHKFGFKDPW